MMVTITTFLFPLLALQACLADNARIPSYSVSETRKDPNLKEITFDLGYGEEFFEVFTEPSIASMTQGNITEVRPVAFSGHGVKFINMSPETVHLYW